MLPLVPRDLMLQRVTCPVCCGTIQAENGDISLRCAACRTRFAQQDPAWIDLIPAGTTTSALEWLERQSQTEASYAELARDPAHAALAYQSDCGAFRPQLAELQGRVLDLGGGNGVLRHYLPCHVEYTSVDPSSTWLDEAWLAIADSHPCLRDPLRFVQAVGEHLPFPAGAFDAVVAFWTLNHVMRPAEVIAEIRRVLVPGGRVLIVLEDVPPGWLDIWRNAYVDARYPTVARVALAKLASLITGWPLQPDHLRIVRQDMYGWAERRFSIEAEGFRGTYFWVFLRRQ